MNFFEKAPAKLNLSLNLTGETKDNYHFLVSLIVFLDLQDMLSVERSDRFSYEISGAKKNFGNDDLVMKSLNAILKRKKIEKLPAVKIVLDKKIPIGAGLGGGSADAAATIRLLNRYMRLNMSLEEMTKIAFEIGSDVPSCLVSEPLILSGYGENIVKIPYFPDIEILLIYPNLNVVTKEVFDQINKNLEYFFPKIFGGGKSYLEMTDNDLLNTGITIMAKPPGKLVRNISLLSGGEKAGTGISFVFSMFKINPAPFCLLDEVDAPLDEGNNIRFCSVVKEMSEQIQFIFITHNKSTMELADILSGVTMREAGVSKLVSVNIKEAMELNANQNIAQSS